MECICGNPLPVDVSRDGGMVDTMDLKSIALAGMRVRLPLLAPNNSLQVLDKVRDKGIE